jgi:hypothetical protein
MAIFITLVVVFLLIGGGTYLVQEEQRLRPMPPKEAAEFWTGITAGYDWAESAQTRAYLDVANVPNNSTKANYERQHPHYEEYINAERIRRNTYKPTSHRSIDATA